MSDLLIKNIDLPEVGKPYLLHVAHDCKVYVMVADEPNWSEAKAVSIPPHGDLVDREWMREAFNKYAKTGGVLYDLADKAPTIIPASE